jgi:hypothetical protein
MIYPARAESCIAIQYAERRAQSVANRHAPSVMVIRVVHVSSTEMDVISVGLSRVKLRRPRSMEEGPGSEACEARSSTLRGRRKTTGSVRTIASVFFRCACFAAILSWEVSRAGIAELLSGRPALFAVIYKCLGLTSQVRAGCVISSQIRRWSDQSFVIYIHLVDVPYAAASTGSGFGPLRCQLAASDTGGARIARNHAIVRPGTRDRV